MTTSAAQCEQVVNTPTPIGEEVGMQLIIPCTETAKHKVEWGERDMHPGLMLMCDAHMKDFLADAEYCEDITWTYVHDADTICLETLPISA